MHQGGDQLNVNHEVVNLVDVNQPNPTQRSMYSLINALTMIMILVDCVELVDQTSNPYQFFLATGSRVAPFGHSKSGYPLRHVNLLGF